MKVLAAEGGYQAFHLAGADWIWLFVALAAGVIGILAGLVLVRNVLAADQGTVKMREIAKAIQEGAEAFLKRQFRTIVIIIVPLAILIFFTATQVVKTGPAGFPVVIAGHKVLALTFAQAGIYRVICFLFGAAFSGLTGFIGMSIAVRGNVRTAAAAAQGGKMASALRVAFRTGAVTGMLCVGLGLVGATAIVMIFQNTATAVLIGFAFGASLLALFMRVGGGIFTKAADVGADLVGKVEAGIPEDDPRNAATIADNVGDNVGDCAGMAADLFESYEITIISSLILGYAAFRTLHHNPTPAVLYPLIVPAIGIFASVIGVYVVRARDKDRNALSAINRGFCDRRTPDRGRGLLRGPVLRPRPEGLLGGAHRGRPRAGGEPDHRAVHLHRDAARSARSQNRPVPARRPRCSPVSRSGSSPRSGRSSPSPSPSPLRSASGGGNIEYTFYLVALIGIGLLATTGMVVSEDSFGPVSDNAAGIAEMSGEFTGEAERIMVSLDAVGNTTKAITKGVAIGSAVIAAVALFASFIETTGSQLGLRTRPGRGSSTSSPLRSTWPIPRPSSAC